MDIPTPGGRLSMHDLGPDRAQFLRDVLDGLGQAQKHVSSKYFYDEAGSKLFDAICNLPEYYPTRTELDILRRHGADMATCLGEGTRVVELGSGSSLKTRLLLDALQSPAGYVPVDISREHLGHAAHAIDAAYPGLTVTPVCADFLQPFALPPSPMPARSNTIYFPGSTLGNFEPATATRLLGNMRTLAGDDGWLLIGLDLQKPVDILERAYNDAQGVTAAFNLNLLRHVNRELEGDFDLDRFEHVARYNREHGRIEMHLRSLKTQDVTIAGRRFAFAEGETLHTENSYKYEPAAFAAMAASAGFQDVQRWSDDRDWFTVWALRAGDAI